jgi:CBS domain-containing protein
MRDAASGRVRHLAPEDTLPTVAATICEARTDALPVIDDVGTVVGVVTIQDILELLATYAPHHLRSG